MSLYIFLLTIAVSSAIGSSVISPEKLTPSSLKTLLSEHEWAHIVGTDADLNDLSLGTLKRHKRDVHSHVSIESNVLPEPIGLRLNPSPDLVDPSFILVRRWANRTDSLPIEPYTTEEEHCLFRSNTAALSFCGRVRGIVTYNNSFYTVSSLPERFKTADDQHHIVLRRSASSSDVYNDSSGESESSSNGEIQENVRKIHRWSKYRRKPEVKFIDNIDINEEDRSKELNISYSVDNKSQNAYNSNIGLINKRTKRATIKRSTVPAIYVETAVFVDRDLHKHMVVNYPKDTERELVRFVLAMINAVQLLYHDSTLGQTVNFVLKRLEILHEDPVNLKRPHDIDRFLSNFCAWQRLENPTGDTDPLHWDHALILTGLDLYVVSKHGKVSSQVVGLAPVAGMCTVTSSCTVNEGRHFESVYVVAHEIGHNLGMRHDGPLAENECDPSSYIMSPTLGSGKITWSPCSKRYLQNFLDTQQSRCLLDHSSSTGKLDHSAEGLLPGERFGADQQCMLKYGKDSRHASQQPLSDICRDLHCKRERYTWTSHPALEGTKCGELKWCRGGRCVGRGGREVAVPPPTPIPGGWGTWTPWVECASGCLHSDSGRLSLGSTGITVSSRKCDQPRPENGGEYCDGYGKKFRTCVATQCLNVPKMTISEFSEQICTRAREVDSELTGTGFQRYNTDASDACSVWCHTRGGGLKSRGWTFPDGTTCLTKLGKKPMHCINGLCVEFKCSNNEDLEYSSNLGQCVRDVEQAATLPVAAPLTSNPMQGPWRRSSGSQWLPASGCHYHCVVPGSGIRIVKSRGNDPKNSIQLCKPDEVGCGHLKTPHEHATYVCTKYKERVRRLSGVGMQISPAVEDPDRPCRIACQDEAVSHRFYLVNGQEGWFPFGTSCSKHKQAYCISGKCLEFGSDNTPLSESEFTLPLLPRNNKNNLNNTKAAFRSRMRYKRSIRNNTISTNPTRIKVNLEQSHLDDIISKLNLPEMKGDRVDNIASPDKQEIFIVDYNNPVFVTPEESVMARVGRHFSYFDYES